MVEPKKNVVGLRLDDDLNERTRAMAKKKSLFIAQLVTLALVEYLDREETAAAARARVTRGD
jgi:predicted transcriptional regulator